MKDNCNSEATKIEKWSRFQLPNQYKRIGWGIIIGSFLLMLAKGFFEEPLWVKPVLRNLMIIGFLMVSISKEKIEDEYIVSMRATTYRLAIIMGTLYALAVPYIDYAVSYLFTKESEMQFSYFQVILFILLIQIMYFNILKRSAG